MSATWLHARLEFNLCHGEETWLAIYRRKKDGDGGEVDRKPLLTVQLSNADLSELAVRNNIKAEDLNR